MNKTVDRTVVRMKDFRPQLNEGVQVLTSKAMGAVKSADGFVRANPWTAMGLVAAAGLLAGLAATTAQLLSRRRAEGSTDAIAAGN